MTDAAPAFDRLSPATAPALSAMLARMEALDEGGWFRPHPSDIQYLVEHLCRPDRRDLHYVLHDRGTVLAYGLLRGWDEGYAVPSLGIAVSPDHRRTGLAGLTMDWLHMAARLRGCQSVRLRVRPDNARAIALYQAMGYQFIETAEAADLLTGIKDLTVR